MARPPIAFRHARRTPLVRPLAILALALLLSALALPPAPVVAQDPAAGAADAPMSDEQALQLAERVQARLAEVVRKVTPAYVRIAGGSGIIISADGYLLTNHHVAAEGHFNVTIGNGRAYRAINVGQDQRGDICLLKLDCDRPLPYVELGDSDALQIGQHVIALGNPFMYAAEDAKPSVVLGVVSALHRFQQGYSDCIMTDARINPGNSGGPLLTLEGKLVGINGRIAVRRTFGHRINTGIGYSIPINQIMRFVRQWRQRGGLLRHGLIEGLQVSKAPTGGQGAVVSVVAVDSEAARAGFRVGDIVVGIDGQRVPSHNRFWGLIGTYPAYHVVTVRVARGGAETDIRVMLAPTSTLNQGVQIPEPPPAGEPWAPPTLPSLAPDEPLMPPDREPEPLPTPVRKPAYLGLTVDLEVDGELDGCRVFRVLADTSAQRAGIRVGDVILSMDGTATENFDILKQLLQGKHAGETIEVRLRRDGREMVVAVLLTEKPR